jgi:protein SCO1/2
MRSGALVLLALAVMAVVSAHPADLPSDSLYRLQVSLLDQDGRAITFDRNRGHVTLVTMFYASCPNVCPLLLAAIQRLEAALSPAERVRLRVMVVSLDPERDTPQVLKAVAARQAVDVGRWTLARAAEADVRKLAAVLDIRYRRLANGEFNHSSVVDLLDAEGRKVAQTSMLAKLEPEFLTRLRTELATRP